MDFSESSSETLKWSVGMARTLKARLTILHPYRLNQLEKKEDIIGVKEKIEKDASKNFEEIANAILKNRPISFEFRSEVGFIHDRVQNYSRSNNILLLAIGKKLALSNKEILPELVEQIETPLVIIPSAKS